MKKYSLILFTCLFFVLSGCDSDPIVFIQNDSIRFELFNYTDRSYESGELIIGARNSDGEFIWEGEGENEIGKLFISKSKSKTIIKVDKKYYRPTEVDELLGDPSKAKEKLGWEAQITFNDLVKEMVKSDYKQAEKELLFSTKEY